MAEAMAPWQRYRAVSGSRTTVASAAGPLALPPFVGHGCQRAPAYLSAADSRSSTPPMT